MRHLEKMIIFSIIILVLIYTVFVYQSIDQKFIKNRSAPASKQEIPAANPEPSSKNEASFFPESDPSIEDKSIIEETFMEVP